VVFHFGTSCTSLEFNTEIDGIGCIDSDATINSDGAIDKDDRIADIEICFYCYYQ